MAVFLFVPLDDSLAFDREVSFLARLPDESVVRLAQQLLKVGQMLQVSQGVLSSFAIWDS